MRNEGRGLARRKERSPLRSFAGLESLTLPLRYGEVAGLTVPSKTQRAEEGRSLRSSRSNLWRACWAEEWPKMTFWQENYGFIKEVYDTRYDLTSLFTFIHNKAQSTFLKLFRYAKMTEWMDNVEMAIAKVLWICFYCSVMIQGNYCWKMNNYKAFLSNQF